jgi:hypothetical protein
MDAENIIEIPQDQSVVCPICKTVIIGDEGLTAQPSCAHVLFVYANGEAFEFDAEGLEARLDAAQEKADEDGVCFDPWETLLSYCDQRDVILEQTSEAMACGPICFKVWIGIRRETKDSRSRHLGIGANEEFFFQDCDKYFRPRAQFIRWMKTQFDGKLIYDVGSGMGHVANVLAKAGLHVTAIDLEPSNQAEFPVIYGDSTEYQFEKGSVVMLCRPCHENGFVRDTILRALNCGVRAIVYVGLQRNIRADLGGYYKQFTKRRIGVIGHADERVSEMKVSRLRAEASMRRGAIPPL